MWKVILINSKAARNCLWKYHLRSSQSVFMHLSSRNLWLIHRFSSEIWWFWLIYSPEKLEFVLHAWCCQKGGPREQAFAEPYGNPSECVKVWSEGITFGPTELVTLRTTLWSNLYLNCRSRHWNAAAILPVLPMAAKHIQTISKYWYLLDITSFHPLLYLMAKD